MRKIALVPVHNERPTLSRVIDQLVRQVDLLIVVNDGSSDGSLAVVRERARGDSRIRVLHLDRNRGMSFALKEGFRYLVSELERGELDGDVLVFTIDADGQHDAGQIRALGDHILGRGLDVALTRRDLSRYPPYKRWGNLFMTLWGSLWSGTRYHDIESGFRQHTALPETTPAQ